MLKSLGSQGSFYDAEYLCNSLIPPDSFYRKFKEIVTPLIKDEHFEDMYCLENGRPPISPSLMAMAVILQFYRGFSDREMETACMYDLQIKFALGLKLDERPFDHSSLGDFRERMLKAGKEKAIFDRILGHLVESGLIQKDEIQRIDATHIIADIAIPTMVTMVKKGIFEIIKPLKHRKKEVYARLEKVIDMTQYTKEKINFDSPGRLDMDKRRRRLVEVVSDAEKVLDCVRELKTDRDLGKRIKMLRRILRENIQKDKDGNGVEKIRKEKGGDLLVSPIDEDARFGAKSKTKKFMGYKANVTETVESRFITNIKAMPGNMPDGRTTVASVLEQQNNDLKPKKMIGDTAYSTAADRMTLRENGTQMVAPMRERNTRTRIIYPKSMFKYDEAKQTLTCPQGVATVESWFDRQKEIKVFHFPMSKCRRCSVQKQCTNDDEGRRTVGISRTYWELLGAEQYSKTEAFKADMKLRPPIEGKLSELVRYHGMRRARYRGLKKLGLQCYFTATAVNIKRWIKIMLEKLKPRPPVMAVSG